MKWAEVIQLYVQDVASSVYTSIFLKYLDKTELSPENLIRQVSSTNQLPTITSDAFSCIQTENIRKFF